MNTIEEQVILVDSSDNPTGALEKLDAHKKGVLHRAFSVFVFNEKNELILQRRALNKYHSPGLWTNTCCSHPRPGEEIEAAAHRRLQEEMGFDTQLKKVFDFIYKHEFDNGLVEHEFDHVFIGKHSGEIYPDASEVNGWKFISIEDLKTDLRIHEEKYTVWFKMVLDQFSDKLTFENKGE